VRNDEATGLPGYTAFCAALSGHLRRAERHGSPLTLALVEVEGLQQVRHEEGRSSAEARLAAAGWALASLAERDRDLSPYRVGAHTFALVMTSTTMDDAFTVADAVSRRFVATIGPATATIGLAEVDPDRCPDAETLVIAADAALDQAWALGGSRVVGSALAGSGLRWIASHP
jgi:PleD family two-component response regulator